MWPFTRARTPPAPRLRELDERLQDVEKAIDWLKKADRELNARMSAVQRKVSSQDAPGPANETPPGTGTPPSIDPQRLQTWRARRGFLDTTRPVTTPPGTPYTATT